MPSLPVIAIVGRPNVGKSSLLNALTGKKISIVQDMPGVTRDRVSIPLEVPSPEHGDRWVELVDTGGYGFVDPDALTDHIKHQIELAMSRANLVLFIVDCQDGLTAADQEIATLLHTKGIKSVLIANKADSEKADLALADFARLGFGTPIGISALNNRNIGAVFEAVRQNVDLSVAPEKVPEPELLVAIVGKRNAGKSTLVNSVARLYEGDGDRVIVSEVPGTTRDSIDVRFEKEGHVLTVIDTAGVRKKRHMVTNDVEYYSFHRAQRSVRRADVVLLLIDATSPVSEPDKKLAQYIAEQFKPVILVVNKWDLAREELARRAEEAGQSFRDGDAMEQYRQYIDQELRHLTYAPIAFVTAKDGKNIKAVLDLCQHLHKQSNERIGTGRLNRAVKQIFEERVPSTPRGQRVKVYYATQIDVAPPTIVLVVNNPDHVEESYQRFMVNRFRELLPFAEVPIKLLIRPRGPGMQAPEGVDLSDAGGGRSPRAGAKKVAGKRPPKRGKGKPQPKKLKRSGPSRGTRPH